MTRQLPVRLGAALLVLCAALVGASSAAASDATLNILPTGIDSANPLEWRPYLLIALVAVIVVLSKLLNRIVFEPLVQVLEDREKRIDGARSRAGDLAREADALLERYQDAVRETREGADVDRRGRMDEARRSYQAAISEARGVSEVEISRTRAEVGAALSSARTVLEQDARGLARDLAERLLGRSLA